MQEQPDIQLLRAYVDGDEAAFREIVSRHTDLVYSAALRQVNSPDLAQDVTQGVFIDLVRKAREVGERLAPNASLAGWLYRSTRFAILTRLRDDSRRAKHERQAMEQLLTDSSPAPDWERIRPVLDEAMVELSDTDRDAIVLRYFKNHDFHFVGHALGLSDDAAQKRVSRAIDRLREFFSKRGVAIGASGLVVLISANAVQAAPLALAATISTAAVLAGTTIHTSTVIAATQVIAMTTLQKVLVTATVTVLVGASLYEAHQATGLREQVQSLQQQQAPLTAQLQQLQRERDDATNELATAIQENALLKSGHGFDELLKLRSEVGMLRQQTAADTNTAGQVMAQMMNNSSAKDLARVQIRQKLKTMYTPLAQKLNLSPEQTDQLYDLITNNELKKKDVLAKLLSGDVDVETALQARDSGKTELAGQIAGLLGDSGYAQFDQYNHETSAADLVNGLNRELGSLSLNEDQSKRLQELFEAKPDITIDDTDLFRSKESLDALFQTYVDRGHQDLQQAASFLTPEQLAAALTIQSNYFNSLRNTVTLGQQLVTKTAKQSNR